MEVANFFDFNTKDSIVDDNGVVWFKGNVIAEYLLYSENSRPFRTLLDCNKIKLEDIKGRALSTPFK